MQANGIIEGAAAEDVEGAAAGEVDRAAAEDIEGDMPLKKKKVSVDATRRAIPAPGTPEIWVCHYCQPKPGVYRTSKPFRAHIWKKHSKFNNLVPEDIEVFVNAGEARRSLLL